MLFGSNFLLSSWNQLSSSSLGNGFGILVYPYKHLINISLSTFVKWGMKAIVSQCPIYPFSVQPKTTFFYFWTIIRTCIEHMYIHRFERISNHCKFLESTKKTKCLGRKQKSKILHYLWFCNPRAYVSILDFYSSSGQENLEK